MLPFRSIMLDMNDKGMISTLNSRSFLRHINVLTSDILHIVIDRKSCGSFLLRRVDDAPSTIDFQILIKDAFNRGILTSLSFMTQHIQLLNLLNLVHKLRPIRKERLNTSCEVSKNRDTQREIKYLKARNLLKIV